MESVGFILQLIPSNSQLEGMPRTEPNIIITGTPGVGKTSLCEHLTANTGLKHLSINQIAKDHGCHEGWDAEFKSWIVDEDRLLLYLDDKVPDGGNILDWHACDLFPESWIDLVVVLRANPTKLYDRLKARDYPEKKLQENLDAEIMEVILEEAREAFDAEIVVELQSDEVGDLLSNVERIETWIENWKKDNAGNED